MTGPGLLLALTVVLAPDSPPRPRPHPRREPAVMAYSYCDGAHQPTIVLSTTRETMIGWTLTAMSRRWGVNVWSGSDLLSPGRFVAFVSPVETLQVVVEHDATTETYSQTCP